MQRFVSESIAGADEGREESTALAAAVNGYKGRMKYFEEQMEGNGLNRMALLLELKRSKREAGRLKCENKLLRQTIEGLSDSVVREACTSSRYAGRLLKTLQTQ